MLLADLTNTVKLDTGAVRKIYTLNGKAVNALIDLGDEEVFIAYGVDKCSSDDFDLDLIEFRNVQAILKSQKLDLKYEKFAQNSPKASRKKFLLSRFELHQILRLASCRLPHSSQTSASTSRG